MKLLLCIIAIGVSSATQAQLDKNPYRFKEAIDSSLQRDTTPWKYQFAADDLSRMGAYFEMLALADSSNGGRGRNRRLSPEDSIYLSRFKPQSAREYILERAKKEQVIIINEAHHQPLHRTFTTSLLKGLYNEGYRYLGLETFGYIDTTLHQRKYPTWSTGWYMREPQFGNLVREALRVGFTVFPYETDEKRNGGFHNNKEREIDQAKNITDFMKTHPGKYLLHVGYSHVVEGPYPAWEKAMAGRLKEYTGIDPFTINQEALTEHSAPKFELSDYPYISASVPSVLVDGAGSYYNGLARDSSYDIRLYHPRTRLIHGRPHWLSLAGHRKAYFIPENKLTVEFPLLAKAYVAGENTGDAIPYDVIEIEQSGLKKALFLEKGKYTLLLQDRQGHTQQMNISIR
ncbi:hypothetical protein [Paraflavitalea sp. CAU 1676]|uniref:hypothetical protein n=1 Tax=Paraflavitalea sp. CAU 1676 TaxID=3032598 RepID=UPI0023DB1ED3|nr:hypothetical protein [Paraflavitalea sp. CAU 1676]MDF2191021.1 hypothetical protein [Paraflavitalea sp. CAU 1676]